MSHRNNRRFELRKPKDKTAACADCSESEDEGGITRRDLLILTGFTAGAVAIDRKLGADYETDVIYQYKNNLGFTFLLSFGAGR